MLCPIVLNFSRDTTSSRVINYPEACLICNWRSSSSGIKILPEIGDSGWSSNMSWLWWSRRHFSKEGGERRVLGSGVFMSGRLAFSSSISFGCNMWLCKRVRENGVFGPIFSAMDMSRPCSRPKNSGNRWQFLRLRLVSFGASFHVGDAPPYMGGSPCFSFETTIVVLFCCRGFEVWAFCFMVFGSESNPFVCERASWCERLGY